MTLTEFTDKYYLHDSSLTDIRVDKEKKQITMDVELCYWAQDWADESNKNNGMIIICFNNVTQNTIKKLHYDNEILFVKVINSETIQFCIDQNENDADIIKIKCSDVSVTELD